MFSSQTLLIAEYNPYGGTGTSLLQMLRLLENDSKNIVLATIGGGPEDAVSIYVRKLGIFHIRISPKNGISKLSNQHSGYIQKELFRLTGFNQFKKVIISEGTPGSLIGCLKLGLSSFYILHTYPHGIKQKLFGKHLSRRIPKNSKLICVSEFSKSQILRFWRNKLTVQVVPNGVPRPFTKINKNQETPVVLTIGSVENYKNPQLWLRVAIKYLSDFSDSKTKFLWVGKGSKRMELEQKIPSFLKNQICFIGLTDNPSFFYRNSTVYLQPSRVESFGLSVAEALSHGIPCIVSNAGGLPEVVSKNCSFIVSSENVDEYVAALSEILTDDLIWNEMSSNALNHYEEKLSIEIWGRRMLSALGY